MHSPRRMATASIFTNRHLKSIDETEQNGLNDSRTLPTKNKSIEFTRLHQSYVESQQLIISLTTDKLLLTKQLTALKKEISTKQNKFQKILLYIRSELKQDRMQYETRIKELEQEVNSLRRHSTSLKPIDSAVTTTEDYSNPLIPLAEEQQHNLARQSTSVILWQFQEIFSKYFHEDHELKVILQPLLRKMAEMPKTEDLCETWEGVLEGIAHYEREIRSEISQRIGSFYQNAQGLLNLSNGSSDSIPEGRESIGKDNIFQEHLSP